MNALADTPAGSMTQDRRTLARNLRRFHLRHVRMDDSETRVGRPVHVIYFRAVRPGLIEIVRVLHERMEPSRHVGPRSRD
jgi:toxin ParE1/3/4